MSTDIATGGVRISVDQTGTPAGPPVLLMHGLTLTRELVLMGSTKLEQSGFKVIACDARGHGRSSAAPAGCGYGYGELAADAVGVLDACSIERALLIGTSMGAHTALRLAIEHPDRVAGVIAITPGFDPEQTPTARDRREADLTAALMRRAGIGGFLEALETIGDPLVVVAPQELRRRMARHRDFPALADAIQQVVRSRPFDSLADLAAISAPTLVIASRDEYDPRHPYRIAAAYAAALPRADLHCEAEGRAPMAWSRRRLGGLVLDFAETHLH